MAKLAYFGVYRDGTGYAHAAIGNILACEKANIDIACRPVNLSQFSDQESPVSHLEKKDLRGVTHIIQHILPSMYEHRGGVKNIGYVDLETSALDGLNWLQCCNLMDAMMVPCSHNKETLINSGVTKPIFIIPHPCNVERFEKPVEKINIGSLSNNLIFYTIGEMGNRKNFGGLIRSYYTAFSKRDDVVLIIKTTKTGKTSAEVREELESIIKEFKKLTRLYSNSNNYPPIVMLTDTMSEEDIDKLHMTGDVFVSLSKGEGWGIPAHDAMCFGNKLILSKHSGYIDMVGSCPFPIMIDGQLTPCINGPDGQENIYTSRELWFEPSINQVVDEMRKLYESFKLDRNKTKDLLIAKQGLSFNYEDVGNMIKSALEQI